MRKSKLHCAPAALPDPAPVVVTLGPNMCNLSCHFCGHSADIGEFWVTPISGDLPPGHWQCPKCNQAWRIDKTPLNEYGRNKIVPIAARL